jgi:hypothetical protein
VCEIPSAWVLKKGTLVVFDPTLSSDSIVFCKCQIGLIPESSRKNLHRGGFSNYNRVERGFGVTRTFQPVNYDCPVCNSSVNTLSPEFLEQLNPMDLASVDFIVGGKHIISRSSQVLITAMMEQGGCAFDKIEAISSRVVSSEIACAERERMLFLKHRKSTSTQVFVLKKQLMDFVHTQVVTSRIASTVFLEEVKRLNPFIQALFVIAAFGCAMFSIDHNFPWGNAGSSWGVCALFHMFNANGEVFGGQGVTTKSLKCCEPLFRAFTVVKLH